MINHRALYALPAIFACLTASLCAQATEGIPDPKTLPPAKVSSTGVLIITGPRTKAWIAPDTCIMLSPLSVMPSFKPANVYLNLDGIGEELDAEGKVSSHLVNVSGLQTGQRVAHARRLARVTMADTSGRIVEAMECNVENRDPGVHPIFNTSWKDERLKVAIPQRQALGGVYFYTESAYVGRLAETADTASIDCRKMSTGPHTLWSIAETSDGVLLPPVHTEVMIAPRYTMSCDSEKLEYTVPFEMPDVKLNLKVVKTEGVDCLKTRVYIAGNKAAESDQATFDLSIPLKNVPSGVALIEVVAIGKDGQKYAAETMKIEISNSLWDSYITGTSEYQTIKANRREIDRLEQDYQMWMGRAVREPNFIESNTITNVSEFTSTGHVTQSTSQTLRTPGRSGEYLGSAWRDSTEMAQLYLASGRLFKRIKMPGAACSCFRQAIRYAGDNNSTTTLAQGELDAMDEAP